MFQLSLSAARIQICPPGALHLGVSDRMMLRVHLLLSSALKGKAERGWWLMVSAGMDSESHLSPQHIFLTSAPQMVLGLSLL